MPSSKVSNQLTTRKISLKEEIDSKSYPKNLIKTTKYNA